MNQARSDRDLPDLTRSSCSGAVRLYVRMLTVDGGCVDPERAKGSGFLKYDALFAVIPRVKYDLVLAYSESRKERSSGGIVVAMKPGVPPTGELLVRQYSAPCTASRSPRKTRLSKIRTKSAPSQQSSTTNQVLEKRVHGYSWTRVHPSDGSSVTITLMGACLCVLSGIHTHAPPTDAGGLARGSLRKRNEAHEGWGSYAHPFM